MANVKKKRSPTAVTGRANSAAREAAAQSTAIHNVTTVETRLAAKAARGDHRDYTGLSVDEMSRDDRHRLLYGD